MTDDGDELPARVKRRLTRHTFRGHYSHKTLNSLRDVEEWVHSVEQSSNDPTVFFVRSRTDRQYRRVQFVGDDWITCSCLSGRHSGGMARCYHGAMAELIAEVGK